MSVWGYSFGGSIARYLGSWSHRVQAIAVIGVPFGRAVHEEFDRFIDEFIEKYEPLARASNKESLNERKRRSTIKAHIPVWVACFQAMPSWPSIAAADLDCAALLLAGSRNNSVMEWLKNNDQSLESAEIQVEIIAGLTHQQEFTKINQVFPIVRSFFEKNCLQP